MQKLLVRNLYIVLHLRFPENDIALLKIKGSESLLNSAIFKTKPVCVPSFEEAENLLYIESYYYGLDPEVRYMKKVRQSLILPGSECDKTINKGLLSGKDSVCLKFAISGPAREGGVLLTQSKSHKFYLTGIASWVGSKYYFEPDDWKMAYFSHVKYFVKYLEYQAHEHKSLWCKTPRANFEEPKLPSEETFEADLYFGQTIFHEETLNCVCGHKNVGVGSPRIMNGVEATPYEFGWMVRFVQDLYDDMGNFAGRSNCGGSIINDRIILTAAHCIWDQDLQVIPPVKNFHAYIRLHNANITLEALSIEVKIAKIIVHPGYISNDIHGLQYDYDIALVILDKPLSFPSLDSQNATSYVPICLPEYEHDYQLVGRMATVAGWGANTTNYTDKNYTHVGDHPTLQKLTKPILSLEECQPHMGIGYLSDNYICGSIGLDNDSAPGDSGGPFMIPELINKRNDSDPNYHWIQVGIVSFGDNVLDEPEEWVIDTAAIYTKVQNFLSFINFYSNKHGAKWCKFEMK